MQEVHPLTNPDISAFTINEARALIVYALFYLKLIPAIYADKETRDTHEDVNSYNADLLTLLPVNKLDFFNYTNLELFAKAHYTKSQMQELILLNQIAEIFELDKGLLKPNHTLPSLQSLCAFIASSHSQETALKSEVVESLNIPSKDLVGINPTSNDFYLIHGDPSTLLQCPWISSSIAGAYVINEIDLLNFDKYLPHLKLLATLCQHHVLEKRLENLGISLEQLPEPFLSKFKEYQQFTSTTDLESTEASTNAL